MVYVKILELIIVIMAKLRKKIRNYESSRVSYIKCSFVLESLKYVFFVCINNPSLVTRTKLLMFNKCKNVIKLT